MRLPRRSKAAGARHRNPTLPRRGHLTERPEGQRQQLGLVAGVRLQAELSPLLLPLIRTSSSSTALPLVLRTPRLSRAASRPLDQEGIGSALPRG